MKKTILFAALLLAAVAPLWGQEWKKQIIKGDELLNTKDRVVLVYEGDEYTVAISPDQYYVIVNSQSSTFDFTGNGYAANIGLYNTEGEMVEKTVVEAYLSSDCKTFTFADSKSIFAPKWVKKMLDWIENGKGYIRISAKRYLDERLNILLPTINDDEK